jgi:tetratricopeptide (TPR) repeat protein
MLARSFRTAYPLPSPERLVGREVDLQRLRRVLAQGKDAGAVAFVSGPPGVGKSALLATLIREAHATGVLCLAGGSYEAQGVVPLGPFHHALADYLDLAQTETPTPDCERTRQFGAVLSCLRTLSRSQPVLLCLEDVHAADVATLHLMHYLARQMRRLPLTLIATLRPEEPKMAEPLAQFVSEIIQERLGERVPLGPLEFAGTAFLATTLLAGSPDGSLAQWLHRTSEGNPLFVEQLVFALKEDNHLEFADGEWRSLVNPDDTLPHTIREVIRHRLQRLGPATRDVLSMAAVLGQAFEYPALLAALNAADESVVLNSLGEALTAHLLQETRSGYAFAHTLLHQATYWSISSPRRMRLHALAGETIERLAGTRTSALSAELARHFARGGRASAMRDKALRYGLEAGRRAAALSAHQEALQHYTELWPLVEFDSRVDASTRNAVLEGRARAERELARWDESIDTLTLLTELTDDRLTRARGLGAIVYALRHTDRATEAPAYLDQALRQLDGVTESPALRAVRLQLLLEKALHLFLEGRYRAQATLAEQMLRETAAFNELSPMSLAHSAAGIARMGLGEFQRALEDFEQALAFAERREDRLRAAIAHENLGLLQLRMGNLDTSREHFETALELYAETSAVQLEGRPDSRTVMTLQGLARVSLAQGRVDEARSAAKTASALARHASDRCVAECQYVLGSIHLHEGAFAQAETRFRDSLARRERAGHAAGIVESLVALGAVAEAQHDWEAARQLYTRAVEVAARMDPSPWVVSASRHLGVLLVHHYDARRGADFIHRAASIAESMQQSVEYEPALVALGRLNQSQERAGQAP